MIGSQPAPAAQPAPQPPTAAADELQNHLRLITGDNQPDARRFGATKLLEIASPEAVAHLAAVLRDNGKAAGRQAVCEAIGGFSHPAPALAEPLLELVGTDQPALGAALTTALRQFDNGFVVDRLQTLIQDTTQALPRRAAAVSVLGALGDDIKAIKALVAIVHDNPGALRDAALKSLEAAAGLSLPDTGAVATWWEQNAKLSPTEWLRIRNRRLHRTIHDLQAERGSLIRRLTDAHREAHLRTDEAGRPALLLKYLDNPLPAIRDLGLDLINVRITDRKDVSPDMKSRLVAMIPDPDPALRQKVARLAGALRADGAVDKLLAALPQEPDPAVRASQLKALGQLDDARAIPVVVDRLSDRVPSVVADAALAVGNLARKNHAPAETAASVTDALNQRFKSVSDDDVLLKEAFLTAMKKLGTPVFRPLFLAELAPERNVRIRRAAIGGLAGFGDEAAAASLRPLLASPDPEIRLAAADGLSACGKGEADLAELAKHLDGATEPDVRVRERAWASYETIARRLSPDVQVGLAGRFARPGDAPAQRRRLALLKMAEPNFDKLDAARRSEALELMAQSHLELQDYPGAAARFAQAAGLVPEASSERFGTLAAQAMAAQMRHGDDAAAVTRAKTLTSTNPGSVAAHAALIGRTILAEVDRRLQGPDHAAALRLLDLSAPLSTALGAEFANGSASRRTRAEGLRDAARDLEIDRLLRSLGSDPEAAKKLATMGPAVLPRLHARLAASPTTTAQAESLEPALVDLAQKLAPQWKRYAPGCPPEQRAAALDALKAVFAPAKPKPVPAATAAGQPSTQPASRPAGG